MGSHPISLHIGLILLVFNWLVLWTQQNTAQTHPVILDGYPPSRINSLCWCKMFSLIPRLFLKFLELLHDGDSLYGSNSLHTGQISGALSSTEVSISGMVLIAAVLGIVTLREFF